MKIPQHQFGSTTIARVNNANELKQLLNDPWFDSETIIIKPNWVSTEPADFTDAETLRCLFEALEARIIVTESYHLGRSLNILKDGLPFTIGDREVNWRWLLTGDGWNWLTETNDWDWFIQGEHWEHVRKEDKAFRDRYGFTDLFDEFNVTYINVTEEVWSGRIADPDAVGRSVESRFAPVHVDRLYSMVPQAFYDLRGSTFISFARLKMYTSFTFKNLFGLIPDPLRPWWHGPDGNRIVQSIVDINKIYHALFNVYGICEALNATATIHPDGQYKGMYTGRYNVGEGSGVVACGRDLVTIDKMLFHLCDPSTRLIFPYYRPLLECAEEEFGAVDREVLEESKKKVQHWISPDLT